MNLTEILLYIVLPAIVAGYLYLKKKYSYFDEKSIPHLKPSWPMGSMGNVGKTENFIDVLFRAYDYGKGKDVIAGFYTLFNPTIIVTDPELAKAVTIKDFAYFTDRNGFVNEEDEPLTGHLVAIGGEKWRFLRNKLSPVFTSGKIKSMYNVISGNGDNFVKAIEKASSKGSVDVKDISNRLFIDIVSSVAFGIESKTLNNENPEFSNIFKMVFGGDSDEPAGFNFVYFAFLSIFPRLAKFLKLKLFDKKIEDFFNNVVGESIKYREENNVKRNDFVDMLIQLKNKGSIDNEISTETRKLSWGECLAQAFVFFFAGADTSSTQVAWAMAELGSHKAIQERLRKEIMEKTKANNGELTYDNLHEMTYLNQVVNETLRKYTSVFVLNRECVKDYNIPNTKHVIEKGTQIFVPNICFQNDDRFWENPKEYNPDRFSPENISSIPSMAHMPFGEGPRNCIGMRFALVNVKFAVATIIKNFKVTLDTTKTPSSFKLNPLVPAIIPVGGFWAKFEKI